MDIDQQDAVMRRFYNNWSFTAGSEFTVMVDNSPIDGKEVFDKEMPQTCLRLIPAFPLEKLPERLNKFMNNWNYQSNPYGRLLELVLYSGQRWHFKHEYYLVKPVQSKRFLNRPDTFMLAEPRIPNLPHPQAMVHTQVAYYSIIAGNKTIICNEELRRNKMAEVVDFEEKVLFQFFTLKHNFKPFQFRVPITSIARDIIFPPFVVATTKPKPKGNEILPYNLALNLLRYYILYGRIAVRFGSGNLPNNCVVLNPNNIGNNQNYAFYKYF